MDKTEKTEKTEKIEKTDKTVKKELAQKIVQALKEIYPDATCALEYHGDPWRLLVMGRLSAQCTDKRVNLVCRELFSRYPTPQDMTKATLSEVEAIIRPCGLYHTKAADLIASSQRLVEQYGGILPDQREELLQFPGVGRKIANLLLGDLFGQPAIVADTHCIRISARLGLVPTGTKDPVKVEKELSDIIVPNEQCHFCHRLVLFGREFCMARSPACDRCPLEANCISSRLKEDKLTKEKASV
jgi:endonuclease-3